MQNEEKRAAGDWEKKTTSGALTKGKSLFEALTKYSSSRIPYLEKTFLETTT